MESLLDILGISVPLWALLPFAILSFIGQAVVFIWLMRLMSRPASAANNALTRAIRRWLGTSKIVAMSQSEIERLGGIDKIKLDSGDILIQYED